MTNAEMEPIAVEDVTAFMNTLGTWARALPEKQQAMLHLMLATAAAAEHPDVSAYLAAFPIPNPEDIIVAAAGSATGTDAGAVTDDAGAQAIMGDLTGDAARAAAGTALARALLNNWAERAS